MCRIPNTDVLLKSPSSTSHVPAIPSVITHLASRIELAAISYFENNKTKKIRRLESQRVVSDATGVFSSTLVVPSAQISNGDDAP